MKYIKWGILFIILIFLNIVIREHFVNYNKKCASLCANIADCDAYLVNPKTRQCISYTFSKNKQLKTNYGCSPFKNGQYYGNIKNNISTQFSKVLSPPPKAQKVLAVFGDGCTKRETVYTVENGRISSCIKNKYSCGKNTSGADDAWCESKVNSSNNGYLVRACFQDRCWNKNKVVCGNWSPNTSIYRGWTDVTCKLKTNCPKTNNAPNTVGSDFKKIACGDCDFNYITPLGTQKVGLDKCAQKCRELNCKRFSYSTTNAEGGTSLGCRISKGNSKCPNSVSRYCKPSYKPTWKGANKYCCKTGNTCGKINYWGGSIYDKIYSSKPQTENRGPCPGGYTPTSKDVQDGPFNVNNNNVDKIVACSKLCNSDSKCKMFEFNANAKRCKVSSGKLGTGKQYSGWQSCVKNIS